MFGETEALTPTASLSFIAHAENVPFLKGCDNGLEYFSDKKTRGFPPGALRTAISVGSLKLCSMMSYLDVPQRCNQKLIAARVCMA